MTLQEIYNKVRDHLLTQNAKATKPETDTCQYLTSDGKKCAVGCLITPENYSPNLEGEGLTYENVRDAVSNSLKIETFHTEEEIYYLLQDLQNLHDEIDVGSWPDQLKKIAIKHNLVP